MTRKQELLKLAEKALIEYAPRPAEIISDEFTLWIQANGWPQDETKLGTGCEAYCLYFCLLAAMEEE